MSHALVRLVLMSKFAEILSSEKFAVTSELNPPKGTDLTALFNKADGLKGYVDAFNLTDSHSARMCISPTAVAHLLLDRGVESIVQMTTRDRNRIALQADMLAASALGVYNLLFMGGDPPTVGDHPDAKPVFDVLTPALLTMASGLQSGRDMSGNELKGAPTFCLGAVVNPGSPKLDDEIDNMKRKIDGGARFFQSQAVYDTAAFEKFVAGLPDGDFALLAGIIPIKSTKMAQYMNEKVPGIDIPKSIIQEIADAEDVSATSVDIAARTIKAIKPMCQGVHVMAMGWESKIPQILEVAGIH